MTCLLVFSPGFINMLEFGPKYYLKLSAGRSEVFGAEVLSNRSNRQ